MEPHRLQLLPSPHAWPQMTTVRGYRSCKTLHSCTARVCFPMLKTRQPSGASSNRSGRRGGRALASRPWTVALSVGDRPAPAALGLGRGAVRAERLCGVLDGRWCVWAHALPSLPVSGSHLVREGKDEAPVVIAFLRRRFAFQEHDRIPKVLESVIPQLLGRVVSGVI